MKFYIATRLENHAKHNQLRDILTGLGHEITYDWTTHGPVRGKGLEVMNTVADAETFGVIDADVLLVLLPGGRGTHVELGLGMANPNTTDVIIWSEDPKAFSHDDELTCAFYHGSPVTQYHGAFEDFLQVVIPYLEGKYGNAHHAH
jgi:hypothetical protein